MRNDNVWELDMYKELRKYEDLEEDGYTSIPELIDDTGEILGEDNQIYYS